MKQPSLQFGREVRCPKCRQWHPVHVTAPSGNPHSDAMLYFNCKGGSFYAGHIGGAGKLERGSQACMCIDGWICEEHPSKGWPHDHCPGPGMPCIYPACPVDWVREKRRPEVKWGHPTTTREEK